MHDEPPAPRTTTEPTADSPAEPTADRRERDDRPERSAEAPATGSAPRRSPDGVDPPEDTPAAPSDDTPTAPSDDTSTAPPDADRDCGGDDPDEEPLAYRLERLRLWRTLAALAVVVARLIRSL